MYRRGLISVPVSFRRVCEEKSPFATTWRGDSSHALGYAPLCERNDNFVNGFNCSYALVFGGTTAKDPLVIAVDSKNRDIEIFLCRGFLLWPIANICAGKGTFGRIQALH